MLSARTLARCPWIPLKSSGCFGKGGSLSFVHPPSRNHPLILKLFGTGFSQYVIRAPVVLPTLTGARLQSTLLRMCNHSSGGADGWNIAEMKTWPEFLFVKLADLLNDVEASGGDWPAEVLLQIVSLIPKDEYGDDQRPVTVACLVYRVWAAVRTKDLCEWQETWIHDSQNAYRRGKRSVDPAWSSAASAEHAWLGHFHRVGFSLDLAKAFGRVPHQILYNLLVASGLPCNFCDTWLGAITGAIKHLKSAYGLGRAYHVNRGLPQGDALACFGMNLLMSVWSRAVAAECDVSVRSFADDATVESQNRDAETAVGDLQDAITVTEEFTTLSNQKPNVQKCFAWSTTRRGCKALASLQLLGQPLLQKTHAKDLGCQALYSGPARIAVLRSRFQKARKAALRVRCAPLRLEEKAHLVTGAACSLATYGLETCPVGDGVLSRLRSAVVLALWGFHRRFRSAHAVLLLFTQSHLTDPFQAQMCQSFLTLQRCLIRDPAVANAWEAWWQKASLRTARPRGPVTLLWKLASCLNWTWVSPWVIRIHTGVDESLVHISPDEFAHHLRDAARIWCWKQAFALHKHFDGVQHVGVDRVATLHMCDKGALSTHCLRLLRSILVDAVWSLSRLFQAGRVDTSACTCGHDHQDAVHFFWGCPLLVDLKAKHSLLMSVRETFGPWPPCLELCGLVPADLEVPQHTRLQVAVLVQSYLLDVLRRSWKEDGWPPEKDVAPQPRQTQAIPEFLVLKLPRVVPRLSTTTFPWPEDFAHDLLAFLRTLQWPKSPTRDGISWAELAVNFEIVIGKALPRKPKKHRARKFRSYGEPAVPLLEAPDNLYTKVLTMSNACRSLARVIGTHVVVGGQSRYQCVPNLPGKHRFCGLDRRPVMTQEDATIQTLEACLHERVAVVIHTASADISAGAVPAANPVQLACNQVNFLKWNPPVQPAEVCEVATLASDVVLTPGPTQDPPSRSQPVSVVSTEKHEVFKRDNRWCCMKCPCSATYSNSARFKNATCLGDRCHTFEIIKGSFTCTKCGEIATNEKEMHGKRQFPCPGFQSSPDAASKGSRKKKPKSPDLSQRRHDVVRDENRWFCNNCPASCSLSNSGRFRTVQCLGDKAHAFVAAKSKDCSCEKCGEKVDSEKQMMGKMPFPCPGPSTKEDSFVHDIPNKPNAEGRYVCRKCKRGSVKGSVSRFVKTLCYGKHATTRSDAIRASRCVAGASKSGLPDNVAHRYQAFRKCDVNMEPD